MISVVLLGSITVQKKVYSSESAQIGISLGVGEAILQGEGSNTSYNVFYSVENLFFVHFWVIGF